MSRTFLGAPCAPHPTTKMEGVELGLVGCLIPVSRIYLPSYLPQPSKVLLASAMPAGEPFKTP
jgi:hypothetical protein